MGVPIPARLPKPRSVNTPTFAIPVRLSKPRSFITSEQPRSENPDHSLVPNKELPCSEQGSYLFATSKSESNRHLLVCNKQVLFGVQPALTCLQQASRRKAGVKNPTRGGVGVLHSHQRYGHSHKIILARVVRRLGRWGGLRRPLGCARHFLRLPPPTRPCYAAGILCGPLHGGGFGALGPLYAVAVLQRVHRLGW